MIFLIVTQSMMNRSYIKGSRAKTVKNKLLASTEYLLWRYSFVSIIAIHIHNNTITATR